MPRDASGNYTTPAGQPVVSATVISSTVFNNLVNDLKTEMTDSLSRSGKGGMLVPLPFADGTVGAPGISFTNETSSGLYRIGASDVGLSIGGTLKVEFLASFLKLYSMALQQASTNTALTLRGNVAAADAGTDVVLDTLATRSAGALVSFKNNGTEKVKWDYTGEPTLQGGFACGFAATSGDTSLTPAGTYVSLSGLSFDVVASGVYEAEVMFAGVAAANTTPNIKWTGPAIGAGTIIYDVAIAMNGAAGGFDCVAGAFGTATNSAAATGGAGQWTTVSRLFLVNGANSGTVQFQAATATTATTAKKGAFIRWRRLA